MGDLDDGDAPAAAEGREDQGDEQDAADDLTGVRADELDDGVDRPADDAQDRRHHAETDRPPPAGDLPVR